MWILDPRVNFAFRSPSSKATPWRGQAAYGLGLTSQLTTHGERGPRWETRLIHLCVPVVPLRERPRFRILRTMTPMATQKWILLQKWLRPMKWVLETYPTPCCELSCLEQADWEAGLPLLGRVEDLLEGIHLWRPIVGKRWACCLQLSPWEPQDQATSDWGLKTALPPGKLAWAGIQASCSETRWKQATGVFLWSASNACPIKIQCFSLPWTKHWMHFPFRSFNFFLQGNGIEQSVLSPVGWGGEIWCSGRTLEAVSWRAAGRPRSDAILAFIGCATADRSLTSLNLFPYLNWGHKAPVHRTV